MRFIQDGRYVAVVVDGKYDWAGVCQRLAREAIRFFWLWSLLEANKVSLRNRNLCAGLR